VFSTRPSIIPHRLSVCPSQVKFIRLQSALFPHWSATVTTHVPSHVDVCSQPWHRVTDDPPFTGRQGVTWPTFEILGTPRHLGNGWSSKRHIWHADSPPGVL